MKLLIALAVLFTSVSSPSVAETLPARACVLTAAEHLPRIPGIEIGESRTVDLPPEMKAKLDRDNFHTIVEISAKVAGEDALYRFICVAGPGVAPIVQRIQ